MLSTPVFDPWRSPLQVPDPELLWIHPPYLRLTGNYTRGNIGEMLCLPPRPGQPYEIRYDRYGFRNDTDLTKADIAVIGDSYVESPYAPTEALMTTVLSRLQRATVVNFGISGFGPRQELVTLQQYAIPLGPKTIIWVFFEGNDLGDVHRYDALRADWSQMRTAAESLWERSFTKNVLLALLRLSHGCRPNVYYDKRYGVVHDIAGQPMRLYFGEEASALSPRDLDALEKTRSILTNAFEQTERHGMQLVVAFAPIAYRVYQHVADFTETGKEFHWWTLSDLPDRLGRILSDISPRIGYVDLTPALVASARQGRLVYLLDDTHWTTEGHAVVAMALNDYLGDPL
ncbi:MAG TPA: SGNH/GDSL hydrolase family protein [Nitrospiraceae bacterium]|nr:SGNH/GDSL hydrolase family protein [Nitrospiraceae bacterium]